MTTDYKRDLEFKLKTVDYHLVKCLNIVRSQEINEKNIIALTSEFIAMMLAYQASLEYLAQYIREKRCLPGKTSEFHFTKLNKLVKNGDERTTDIEQDIKNLFDESQYLRDFSNTVKHRNLIYHTNKKLKIGDSGIYNLVQIDSFKKDDNEYESITLEGFIYDFIKTLRRDIEKVMNKV